MARRSNKQAAPADSPKAPRILQREYEPEAPIDSVVPHPENANAGNVESIAESIDETGFYGSIIVQRSTRWILAGNHRWAALKAAGAETIPVEVYDLDEADALKVLLADNATAEHGKRDPTKVYSILSLIQDLAPGKDPIRGTGLGGLKGAEALLARIKRSGLGSSLPGMNAGNGDDSGDDGQGEDDDAARNDDDSDADEDEPSEKAPADRYPLSVVLSLHENRRWQDYKKSVACKKDKAAFLMLLDAVVATAE